MKTKTLFIALLALFTLGSCVSSKVHKDLQARYDELSNEADGLRKDKADCEVTVKEQGDRIARLEKDMNKLLNDTTAMGKNLREWMSKYDKLNQQYEYVLENNSTLMAASAKENKELMEQLELLQTKLQRKEDSLVIRERKVRELQAAIDRKDSAMIALRNKISAALTGFEGKGLTIFSKNGQVYVSMENSLLFASGSYTVSKKGKEALTNIAEVLAANPDINVLVEGHTDSDKYNGSGVIKDNWDLSVMRATSVVRIMMESADLAEEKVTAGGRGMYLPLAPNDSSENKAKNRRTEIILTPDLSELAEILDSDS